MEQLELPQYINLHTKVKPLMPAEHFWKVLIIQIYVDYSRLQMLKTCRCRDKHPKGEGLLFYVVK